MVRFLTLLPVALALAVFAQQPGFPSRGAAAGAAAASSSTSSTTRYALINRAKGLRCVTGATAGSGFHELGTGTPLQSASTVTRGASTLATTNTVTGTLRYLARGGPPFITSQEWWSPRGFGLGSVGVVFSSQWAVTPADTTGRMRTFVGVRQNLDGGGLAGTYGSLLPNTAFFGCEDSTSIQFCTNDDTGTATCTATGMTCASGKLYNAIIEVNPASVDYVLEDIGAQTSVTGTIATNIPNPNVPLAYTLHSCSDAGEHEISFGHICMGSKP